MTTAAAKKHYTIAEYLELERTSRDVKHEYYNGEIFAMAGASDPHNRVVGNLITRLNNHLEKEPCVVYPSDMMVVCPSGLRTYPDVAVVCDQPQFEEDDNRTLLNPLLIFEVLSPSTEAYDRGKKFEHYRQIPSLQDYFLVAQDRASVVHLSRGEGEDWIFRSVLGLETALKISTLGCTLPLSEVYLKVEFPPDDIESTPTSETGNGHQ